MTVERGRNDVRTIAPLKQSEVEKMTRVQTLWVKNKQNILF